MQKEIRAPEPRQSRNTTNSDSAVPTGLRFPIHAYPALKRWAKVFRAYGSRVVRIKATARSRRVLTAPALAKRGLERGTPREGFRLELLGRAIRGQAHGSEPSRRIHGATRLTRSRSKPVQGSAESRSMISSGVSARTTSRTSHVPSSGPPKTTKPSFSREVMKAACEPQATWPSSGHEACHPSPRVRITANSRFILRVLTSAAAFANGWGNLSSFRITYGMAMFPTSPHPGYDCELFSNQALH